MHPLHMVSLHRLEFGSTPRQPMLKMPFIWWLHYTEILSFLSFLVVEARIPCKGQRVKRRFPFR